MKKNQNDNTLTVLFEESKTVSFDSSVVKYILKPSALAFFAELLLDQHLVSVVHLNLLQLICSIFEVGII